MNKLRRPRTVLILVVSLAWFLIPVFVHSPLYLHLLIILGLSIMFVLSWRLILMTGQLSFAHAGFIGIGAYTSAILMTKLSMNFWVALLMSGLVAATIGFIIGLPILRLKGLFFAISTFAFQEVIRSLWMRMDNPFGGSQGISNIPSPTAISIPFLNPINFNTKVAWFYLVTIFMFATSIFLFRIDKSHFGRNLRAVQSADDLAASLGIDPMYHKVMAFVISCFIVGIAGSLYGHYLTFISPEVFTMWLTTDVVVYGLIGGTSSIFGPCISASILIFLSSFLGVAGYYKTMIYGAFLITFMLFLPEGLISLPQKVKSFVKKTF